MAGRTTHKLPAPEGVAAGSTATFRIPVGQRIHGLILAYAYNATTQNVADFTEIRIFANDQVIQRFTGSERDALNQYDGMGASQGVLQIPFDRTGLKTKAGQEETALNTGVPDANNVKISSMYMEIDLDSGMTITNTDLSLYAIESDAIPGGPGTIPFIRRHSRTVGGADADYQISDLINPGVNAPDKVALNRVTFIPSTGSISNQKISRNNYTIFDRTTAINEAVQTDHGKVPQSGYNIIDTTERGDGGDLIDLYGMTDYRYHLNVSAAMTITTLSEYFGVLTAN